MIIFSCLKKIIGIFIRVIMYLILFTSIIAIFTVQIIKLEGNSMMPTHQDNELGISIKARKVVERVQRFDIVVLNNEEITNDNYWIKRVIGLPNDLIEYKNDKLYINGEYIEEPFLDNSFVKNYKSKGLYTKDFSLKLKENEYFVMGDNRPASKDSRIVGPFHLEDITSRYIINIPKFAMLGEN